MSIDSEILPVSHVEELVRALVRALRAFQMYLPNNPMYQRAQQQLEEAIPPVWAVLDELTLLVRETDLVWEDQVVYQQPSKSESFAWGLYKDGMRLVTLRKGAEEEEIDPPGFNRPHIAASRTFTDDHEYEQKSSPAVPAISVLQRTPPAVGEKTVASAGRSRPSPSVAPRSAVAALGFGPTSTRKPAKSALPTWDDILFGSRED